MKRQPLRIRHTLALVIGLIVASTALGAGALYSYQFYRSGQAAERLRATTIAETYAALLAAPVATAEQAQVKEVLDRINWHEGLCMLAVLTPRRETLASRGSDVLLKHYLTRTAQGKPAPPLRIPGEKPDVPIEVRFADAPVSLSGSSERVGTVICAVRPFHAGPRLDAIWTLSSRLLLIAAAGLLVGLWWLRRSVVLPLTELAGHSRNRTEHDLPVERSDEIGDLARALAEMHISLDEWRQRALRLEHSVNNRVAEETRQVTRELQQAKRKIWIDPLTRIGNRRLLEDRFAAIFDAQQNAKQDLSVVMLDVDNFKTLNDTLGHKPGDELLKFIGELLSQCVRDQDLAVRLGGDEFLLILPGVSAEQARTIAERTLLMFAQQTRLLKVDPRPTMSAGIASLCLSRPADSDVLLQIADAALYDAKRAGKSRAMVRAAWTPTSTAR